MQIWHNNSFRTDFRQAKLVILTTFNHFQGKAITVGLPQVDKLRRKFKRTSLHFISSAPEAPRSGECSNKVLQLTEGIL